MVNPTCSIENNIKVFRFIRFLLNEISQMSKFKLFVSQDKFSRIVQIFLKFASVIHNWKIQKFKNCFKNVEKLEKLAPLLVRWHTKLSNWHAFGLLARLLACWHVKMRSCHTFGLLACGYVDHAGTHGMHFSELGWGGLSRWKTK